MEEKELYEINGRTQRMGPVAAEIAVKYYGARKVRLAKRAMPEELLNIPDDVEVIRANKGVEDIPEKEVKPKPGPKPGPKSKATKK